MPEKAWKRSERAVARELGGERTPLSGSNSKHTSGDGIFLEEYLEHKRRESDPVHEQLTELGKRARRRERWPLVVFDLVDQDGPGARWAGLWLDRYLELKRETGGTPLAFREDSPLDRPTGTPWMIEHQVGRRLPHGQLVLNTIQEAAREERPPLVVVTRNRSPNRVALVPLEVGSS